ncbi:MAG: cytochrome c biogenesis protein CcdA [Oscillospiraceae bacterium]|jgi:cytochrome c-type biogenesis protein|nr:cytochrome c biogenesis protein CcdA [Oscillospiraceae bacterium]
MLSALPPPAFAWYMLAAAFAEGLAAFLSPCVLPMLPVYALYLAGEETEETRQTRRAALLRTGCFVLGFTLVFMALGAGATGLGRLLAAWQGALTRLAGGLLVLMGLWYAGGFRLPWGGAALRAPARLTPWRALAFGAGFAVTWTPCAGVMLGAALVLAGQSAHLAQGLLLLLCFSLGLGVPFALTALLYRRLAGALRFLKRHSRAVRRVSGALLAALGVLMLCGGQGYWQGLFS